MSSLQMLIIIGLLFPGLILGQPFSSDSCPIPCREYRQASEACISYRCQRSQGDRNYETLNAADSQRCKDDCYNSNYQPCIDLCTLLFDSIVANCKSYCSAYHLIVPDCFNACFNSTVLQACNRDLGPPNYDIGPFFPSSYY